MQLSEAADQILALAAVGHSHVAEHPSWRADADRLVELGLAEWQHARFVITPAGESYLRAARGDV